MLAASDASEDETKKGSVAVVDDSLYNLFQEGDHHIAVAARNDALRAVGETGPVSWPAGDMVCRQHSSVDVAH